LHQFRVPVIAIADEARSQFATSRRPPMAKERTHAVNLFIERIKRNPIALVIAFVATLIVSLATLTDAIGQLSNLVGGMSREEAREELRKLGLQYTTENYVESARNSDGHVVQLFLIAGMGADAHDGGITALMHAAANNDGPMIALLLKAGADVNYSDTLGIAATYADQKMLRQLINQHVDSDAIDRAFAYAAPAAKSENLAMLWEKVTDRKKVTSRSLLNVAEHMKDSCPAGATERIRFQLQLGADANITDDDGYFPLLYVAQGKCVDAARLLLDAGANVNARCACSGWLAGGWTALLVASDHDESQQIVELLLDHNSDMQARNNDGDNALALAVEKNNSGVVDLLVKNHIDLNTGDTGGVTPLMNASGRGLLDMMHLLIESGADVDARSKRGYTALMRAAREANPETLRYLIERKAGVDFANEDGKTALIFAADRHSDDATAVRYLLEQGAAVDLKDKEGHTALMLAAQQGNAEAVQLLIARGAQAASKDTVGRTAADLVTLSLAGEEHRDNREKILYLLKQKKSGR